MEQRQESRIDHGGFITTTLSHEPTKALLYNIPSVIASSNRSDAVRSSQQQQLYCLVDWLRSHGHRLIDMDDPTLIALGKAAGITYSISDLSPQAKVVISKKLLDWLRQNTVPPDSLDEPRILKLSQLANLPMPEINMSKLEKDRTMDQIMQCIRNTKGYMSDTSRPLWPLHNSLE
jgi:hypothetical protein